MKKGLKLLSILLMTLTLFSCSQKKTKVKSAADILGNPNYLAISYGGYRGISRDIQPSIADLKEDMKLLEAMHIKILRTYNTKLKMASNILEAIKQLKAENPNFEMYVMLGAWIDCENAWTANPNHDAESLEANTAEIERAVTLANKYPDIVKIIAVGNEAMVHWASSYFVRPNVILKYVNYLQKLKKEGKLASDLWITSSDNFASWGGGSADYHTEDLTKLLKAVDYVSLHTYPFHDTHYNNSYWLVPENEKDLSTKEKIDEAMVRVKNHAISEYQAATDYIKSLGIDKPIHIGETGWATSSDGFYGDDGSKAADEYKASLYYKYMREWTNNAKMSCFYFEGFDEQWKDSKNPQGSENHFGLINLKGQAKYVIWDLVDAGAFNGLTRNGNPITKTFNGDTTKLMQTVFAPPILNEKNNKK
jgi:exo-beta-1,3-glucanase (GH17 family)